MSFENIPEELRALRQWLCYKLIPDPPRKPKKIPVQTSGEPASTTDPQTWCSFDEALAAAPRFAGIGFVFTKDDPFVALDFDSVLDANGVAESWVERLLAGLNSYTEISQSGHGLHVIVKGKLPGEGCRKHRVEAYEHSRYFALTGEPYVWCPGSSRVETRNLKVFHQRMIAGQLDPNPPAVPQRAASHPVHTGNSESEQDFSLIRQVRQKLGKVKGLNPLLVCEAFARGYPQRFSERNKTKGMRGHDTYIMYCIKHQIRSGR